MKHGDKLPGLCHDGQHGTHPSTLGTQNDRYDVRCPGCTTTKEDSVHNHLHTEPPYKAGCYICRALPLVRCKCGQYH